MSNRMFDLGREGFALGEIDWDTAVIKMALVRGYTYNAAHKFVSDLTTAGGTLVATSAALANKTGASGVMDADDVTFTSVAAGAAITGVIIFQSSAVTGGADVAASAQRLIHWADGKQLITIAAGAAGGATTVTVDPALAAIANGATLTKVSGTGPASITMGASSVAGARSLTVTALSGAVAANDVYEVSISGNGLPLTPDGNNITITHDNGANKIFKL